MRYSGVMITCCGSRLPAVNRISSATLTFTLTRVSTNATPEASASTMITAGTVISTEFQKKCGMSDWVHASRKFWKVRWCGIDT
ncbi:hypothetical protein VSR01_34310 [Actinacidiphila sp. DG2A-62]|nr:hypothetical protein [Actinacidiphila sp. DG2A-62]MEC3998293.1 hypothetical protein [Actinacidiphila sp. DG2A-62]